MFPKSRSIFTIVFGLAVLAGIESQAVVHSLKKVNKLQFQDSTKLRGDGLKPLEKGVYIVIGAFRELHNAVDYKNFLASKGYESDYGTREDTEYYYVYLYKFEDVEQARSETWRLRGTQHFKGAWMLRVNMEDDLETLDGDILYTGLGDSNLAKVPEQQITEPNENKSNVSDSQLSESERLKKQRELENSDYVIYFNTFRIKDNAKVQASIEIIDNVRAKYLKKLKAHEMQGLMDPKNGKHSLKLICNVFGYRKVEHDILLDQPINDDSKSFVRQEGDSIFIDFPLERLKPGDIAVMYNVYFFNDAAVMRPESRYEVNSLLEMLQEDDKLSIKIHGHTNSNRAGKIIKLDKGQNNYFKMSKDNLETFGSAKELSKERGFTMKQYLVEQGVEESRMEVKGWGGKKMIYDKDKPEAKKNIRVEIEILKSSNQ
ncbi:OmpA family protein [Fulvivirgaceae bacterium BMA10]|uniref:OmpA family protein n=1 Tax=Splendidivirga corallicola TaxID=3051826 RepID=A0ABT8L0F7_9BACT|nr:OmpA family protein [Fulvivirgaceae bacterium BMA10]